VAVIDLDHIRPSLAELIARHAITLDENGRRGRRPAQDQSATARENVAQLVVMVRRRIRIAGDSSQRRRRKSLTSQEHPADGLITGVATVNADKFGAKAARCMVISYDYTVLAAPRAT